MSLYTFIYFQKTTCASTLFLMASRRNIYAKRERERQKDRFINIKSSCFIYSRVFVKFDSLLLLLFVSLRFKRKYLTLYIYLAN